MRQSLVRLHMPRYFGKPCPECPYGKVLAPLPEDRIGYLADFPDMLVEQMPYIRTGLNMKNFEPCDCPGTVERTCEIRAMEADPSLVQKQVFPYALAAPPVGFRVAIFYGRIQIVYKFKRIQCIAAHRFSRF